MRSQTGVVLCAMVLAACSDAAGPGAGAEFVSVGAGEGFSCALTRDGRAWCWGAGAFGQLGNGATATSGSPVAVQGGHRFVSLAVGSAHTCGVDADGAAWCWGLNDYSELGAPTSYCNANLHFIFCSDTPVRVAGGTAFRAVVAAGYASCGVAATGDAFCWGWSTHGQLGVDSVRLVVPQPLAVVGGQLFAQLSLDQYHACGITLAGAIWCWGANQYGQLGVLGVDTCLPPVGPGISCSAHPVLSNGTQPFASVSAGKLHTCALTAAGAALCWGSNETGVLGTTQAAIGVGEAVPVAGGWSYSDITAGADHTCALRADGRVLCWGMDDRGQSGGAAPATATCPAFGAPALCAPTPREVALPAGVRVVQVNAGRGHSCAVAEDATVWCWGRGTENQLGGGAAVDSRVPVRVRAPE